jgi:hypothetical protein
LGTARADLVDLATCGPAHRLNRGHRPCPQNPVTGADLDDCRWRANRSRRRPSQFVFGVDSRVCARLPVYMAFEARLRRSRRFPISRSAH